VDFLTVASGLTAAAHAVGTEAATEGGLTINLFWVIVSALNFIVFFALIWAFAFKPISRMLDDRRERIEQGLNDAEQARRDRESAEQERMATLAEARREANDILARAQKVAQETREADIAATRQELERRRRSSARSRTCGPRSPISPSPRPVASSASR
jgi:F0F1-type ATP synthase membrane subunit b/b'